MRDLAFFAVLLPLLPMALRYPTAGVLLWAWSAIMAPNQMLYGFMAALPYGKLVAGLTIVTTIFSRQRKNFRLDRTLLLMIALLLAGTVSAFNSIADTDLNWDLYGKLAKILVFAYVISAVMGTRVRIHALVCAMCLALGFDGSTQGLMYIASGGGHKILGSTSLGDNNGFALAVLMILPLMYYLYRYSVDPFIRFSWLMGTILSVVAVIGSFSRGGFIGLAILALLFVFNSRRKVLALLLISVAALSAIVLAPPEWFHRIDSIRNADEDSSFMGRIVDWKMSLLVALDHPLFGGGFHAIQSWPVWSSYRILFHTLDFIPTTAPGDLARAAHSIYFEVLGDLGFVGLSLFLALLFVSLLNARAVMRLTRRDPAMVWAHDLACMLQFSLIVYLVSGAALSMAYFELLYIELAVLSRLRTMVKAERTAVTVPRLWQAPPALAPQLARR